MNTTLKKISPYLIILLGLILLFFIGQAETAVLCILLGIVMILLNIWLEEWEADKLKKSLNKE